MEVGGILRVAGFGVNLPIVSGSEDFCFEGKVSIKLNSSFFWVFEIFLLVWYPVGLIGLVILSSF